MSKDYKHKKMTIEQHKEWHTQKRIIVRYDIRPKSHEEYCDIIDAISVWLDRNNVEHTKTEIEEEKANGQYEILNAIKKHNPINRMVGRGEKPTTPRPNPSNRPNKPRYGEN